MRRFFWRPSSLSLGDKVAREKAAYAERPEPHFRTYGPKTRRAFLRFAGAPG
jgi:hypothetical protein